MSDISLTLIHFGYILKQINNINPRSMCVQREDMGREDGRDR